MLISVIYIEIASIETDFHSFTFKNTEKKACKIQI